MLRCTAIKPNRIRIIYDNRKHLICLPTRRNDKSGVETTSCGRTGAREIALDNVVMAREEVEDEGVTRGGLRGIGREG